MKAVDTNIVVRLIARDDLIQRAAARATLAQGAILLLPSVVMEAEWVLRSSYAMPRAQIAEGLLTIARQAGVTAKSGEAVAAALTAYAQAGDFADLLHAALAAEAGAGAMVTFDRRFAVPPGCDLALEIL